MKTFAAVALALAVASSAAGQEFRGAITGRVSDKSGGVLPGVTVTATNVATNVSSTTVTTGEGLFTIPYLTAGTYSVAAELSGFKKSVRSGIDVRIGDRLVVDLTLEVGQLEETVLVTAASPLLELGSASAGQVIDEKRISMMPLSDGNPFVLSRLVPGVAFTGDLKFSRPFDNAGTSSITADGSSGGNEFTLDGSPNMTSGRRVAFVPPAGAVQQFKVGTASFDAADGHTAGAVVNVTLKSGTNSFRGESYYYLRRDQLSATDFFVNKAGATKPELKYDRPGGFLGGPLRSNRTFLFGAVEWLTDRQQLFVRYTRNDRRESRNAIFGEVNGTVPTGNFLYRTNDGVTYDQVYTATNNTLVDVRAGWQRFKEPNVRQHEGLFDPSALGFSSAVAGSFGGARYFPHFDFDQFSDIGDNLSSVTNHSIYSFQPTVTRIVRNHAWRAG